jgi:cytochrome c
MRHASALATIAGSLLAILALAPSIARGATPEEIATRAGCPACHALDKKTLGPSYRDIAARYKGDARAPGVLAAKVRSGGNGVWGKAPMPALDAKRIADADLGTLLAWILRQ